MALRFEVSTSVTLVGKDLQFVGIAETTRIRVVIHKDALKLLARSATELTQQEKFKVYDRNRELLQEIARRMHEHAPAGVRIIKIGAMDL